MIPNFLREQFRLACVLQPVHLGLQCVNKDDEDINNFKLVAFYFSDKTGSPWLRWQSFGVWILFKVNYEKKPMLEKQPQMAS